MTEEYRGHRRKSRRNRIAKDASRFSCLDACIGSGKGSTGWRSVSRLTTREKNRGTVTREKDIERKGREEEREKERKREERKKGERAKNFIQNNGESFSI